MTLYDLTLERYERETRQHRIRLTAVAVVGTLVAALVAVAVALLLSGGSASATPQGPTIGFGGQPGHTGCYEVNTTGSVWQHGDADGGTVCGWEPNTMWTTTIGR